MQSLKRELDFTRGPILGSLLAFSLPILLAMLLQALYGAVDLAVVGKFAPAEDVSGVAIGSQLTMSLVQLIGSFAMGTTILLGQTLGAGERKSCGRVTGVSIALFLCIGVLLTVLIPLCSDPITALMNTPAESFVKTRNYVAICGVGSVMIVAYNLLGGVMRGMGDSRTPLLTVFITSVFNVVGDYVLIARLHMGAEGAAIATVASQTASVLISLAILRRRGLSFPLSRRDVCFDKAILRRLVRFGGPVCAQDALIGISFLVLLVFVNSLGMIPSAGLGVAEKACAFIMLVPSAFAQAVSAFAAQNYGAGKYDRAFSGLKLSVGLSALFGAVMFWLSFFHGDVLCSAFSRDERIVAAGFDYLKAYGVDCLFTCFLFCFIGFYNGLGYTGFVMVQGVAASLLIRVPVAYLMLVKTGRLFYIGLAVPCSTVAGILACFAFYPRVKKRLAAAKKRAERECAQ